MHRFYLKENIVIDSVITIMGDDVNHIKNVLRLKPGDKLIVCDGRGKEYCCCIKSFIDMNAKLEVNKVQDINSELPVKIYLYQGLPKKDKMEFVIQKSVELGIHEIVPVITKRTIVKLEDKKKEAKKLERWQMISESAAKQSGRGIIPRINHVVTFKEALEQASVHDMAIIPYELAGDMNRTREIIKSIKGKKSAGVFIGPEGGFEEDEIVCAERRGFVPVTLGGRILRTETAALMVLAFLNFELA